MQSDVLKGRVKFVREHIFDLSQRQWAKWFRRRQGAIQKWEDPNSTNFPPIYEIALHTGVSADWLVGLSDSMWGDRIVSMRRQLRVNLAAIDVSDKTPTERFWLAVATTRGLLPDVLTAVHLAAIMRLSVETLVIGSDVDSSTVAKLAEFVDVPIGWFIYGDSSLLKVDEYSDVIERAKRINAQPAQINRFLDALEAKK